MAKIMMERMILKKDGSLKADLNKLVSGYNLFENADNFSVDFLLMGSANYEKETAQALANKLIDVADTRKDAIAFISPYRKAFLTDTSDQGAVLLLIMMKLLQIMSLVFIHQFLLRLMQYLIVDTSICLIDSQIPSDMSH